MTLIRQIGPSEELKLRRFILTIDPIYALSSVIKDYFLSGSDGFGVLVVENEQAEIEAMACYSIMLEKQKSFIHYWIGDINHLDAVQCYLELPCQIFLKDGVIPSTNWREELKVTPGYIIDHPAYSGVFTRSVPRFSGMVYEHD